MNKKYSIRELVDIDRLRALFEDFSKATGFTTGFVSFPDQELLITTGWRDICTQFHRACPASTECCKESNVYLTGCLKDLKELSIKPCGNGLVDGATPVIVRGVHLASLATGQVLLAPPDLGFFRKLAKRYGYDTKQYLTALSKVPVVSEEQLKSALTFLSALAVRIAEEGLSRLENQETAEALRKSKEAVDAQVAERTAELQRANAQLQSELLEHNRDREALRQNESLLRGICETMPDPIFVKDLESRMLLANPAVLRTVGKSAAEVLGKSNEEFFSDRAAALEVMKNDRRIIRTGIAEAVEERIPTTEGMRIFLSTKTPYRNADGRIVGTIGITRDITERKQAEEATRESEQRFRELVEQAPEAIIVQDLDQNRWVSANKSAEKLFGCSREELLACGPFRFYAPHQPDGHRILETKHERDKRALAGQEVVFERVIRNARGKDLICEVRLVRQTSVGRKILRTSFLDITARKKADQALREAQAKLKAYAENLEAIVASRTAKLRERTAEREQLQEELLKISEREKQVIAQELHDGLCQHLAGTVMMGSLLHRRLAARQDPEADYAKQICDLLNTGISETRNLSHGLHPVSPKGDGLMEALSGLAQMVTKLFHVQCIYRGDDSVLINDQAAATHLFRITQEAVNNAIKHGQATQVVISLKNTKAGARLSIRDNGLGLPADVPTTGMGLQIMRHRASSIGAVVTVRRAGKRGTLVCCTLPSGS